MSRPSNSSSLRLISPSEMEKFINIYILPDQCSIHEIGSILNTSKAEIQKNLFLSQFNKFINSNEKKHTILLFDNLLNTWSTLYLEKTRQAVSAKHILSIQDNAELDYLDENTQKPHADKFLNFALKQATITTQVIKDTRQDHCSQRESGHLALFNSFLISQDEPVNQNSFNNQDSDDCVFQDFIANLEIKRIGLQKLLQIQKEKIKSQINKESPQKSLREKLLEERFTEQNYKKNKKFIHALFGNPELINRRHFVDCFRNNSSLPAYADRSGNQSNSR